MRWSDVTTSPVFEDVRRTAVLEALARGEFAPSSTPAESHRESSGADSRFPYEPRDLSDFATACFGASVDSSSADPAPRLIHRIVTATRHDEVIPVLRLLGCRGIADRLDYLHAISGENDPDEPPMALDSAGVGSLLREGVAIERSGDRNQSGTDSCRPNGASEAGFWR